MRILAKEEGPTPSCKDEKEETPEQTRQRTATDNLLVRAVEADPPKWRDKRRKSSSGPSDGAEKVSLFFFVILNKVKAAPTAGAAVKVA